jgi:hypothetical protein
VLQELEESLDKGETRRYTGFEQDDQYSRDFFRLNLKYDFFINPNLTDAELQAITNEARTRIVRLYADSYKNFLTGFEILQELQQNLGLNALIQAKELAKKQTENPATTPAAATAAAATAAADKSKDFDLDNIESFPQEKEVSERIYNDITKKDGVLAKVYYKKYEEIVKIVNSNSGNEQLVGEMWNTLRILNRHAISDVIKSGANINDKMRERISSRFNSVIIRDPTRQKNQNDTG